MNDIAKTLDRAYAAGENVCINGLSGIGKTSIVRQWLEDHKEINGVWFDGALLRTPEVGIFDGVLEKNGLTLIGREFSSDEIDLMCRPDTVIVIDNYHLADEVAKAHVDLLCDGFVVDGREEDNFKELPDVRFVCAIVTTR